MWAPGRLSRLAVLACLSLAGLATVAGGQSEEPAAARGFWDGAADTLVQLLPTLAGALGIEAEPQQPPPLPSTVWMAPVMNPGGFSSEALAYAQALQGEFARHPSLPEFGMRQFAEQMSFEFQQGLPPNTREVVEGLLDKGFRRTRWDVAICHATPDVWLSDGAFGWGEAEPCPPPGARFSVGRAMYETDRIPEAWVPRINSMDEVWVPSAFAVEQFASSGVQRRKLVIVPEAVDTDFFDPRLHTPLKSMVRHQGKDAAEGRAHSGYRFLSVFKWEARKGWDVLLSAYFSEFSKKDPVELYIKTQAFHTTEAFQDTIRKFVGSLGTKARRPLARYHLIAQDLPASQLPRLYRSADALVQPSRGEGWGRPHVEAMAMGLPVIATNWSGTMEFLRGHSSLPLRIDGLRRVPKGSGPEGHRWAEPSTAHLRLLMRWCLEHPLDAKAIGNRAREEMVKHYSPKVVAQDHLVPRLASIAGRIKSAKVSAESTSGPDFRETL